MQVLIIEDEATAARRVQRQLVEVAPEAEVLAVLDSVEASRIWLATHPQPDLLLMDIHLGDGTSFDLLAAHPVTAPIIFTTAYDEPAMRAFQAHSVGYLLKPIKATSILGLVTLKK
jgi:two-component system, LytTR family, response regulator